MCEPNGAEVSAFLNGAADGWAKAMGIRFVTATGDEVVAELEVAPQHLQPYGIVHGGVHAGLIETVASVGAALAALPRGQAVVGLENHTSFIRAARAGRVRARARPVTRGRTTQVWEVAVTDADERLLATGQVRLLCVAGGAALGGRAVDPLGRGG